MAEITQDLKTSTNHNVYILAAGFSADAGLPVLGEFLTKMRRAVEWLSSEPARQTEFEAVKGLTTKIRDVNLG